MLLFTRTCHYHIDMPRSYDELIRYAFKRFCIVSALRTALPTAVYYLRRPVLPVSEKPALFTMNILPPMMTVWHHLARKYIGEHADIVIFDCSGKLRAKDFPGAHVYKFLNFYASTKSDEFLHSIAKNRRIGWICDDDVFFVGHGSVDIVEQELRNDQTACVSFRGRDWWEFDINGQRSPPASSYCTAMNRSVVVKKEHLSLAPANGNTHPQTGSKKPKRYDTFDKANETLLEKGYKCPVLSKDTQDQYIAGFSGMSSAVMLLAYCRTPQQIIDYFASPPKERWTGTVLHDTFGGILAIQHIQELYEAITGKQYELPSLPPKEEIVRMREEYEPLIGRGRTYEWIDEVGAKLCNAL